MIVLLYVWQKKAQNINTVFVEFFFFYTQKHLKNSFS